MNKKGQFSIIAALFVAIILVATVIATYSMIRNSPIQAQPQFLSAIDETNFAIKQILGFTVGYYGSVLQVTGNSSYAKGLAINYLQSGLENVAKMHPDWGTSFNTKSIDLFTYWFTNTSYSFGTLDLDYNLTGLGISGITYKTSCKLNVQIKNSTASNKACIIVNKDDTEPLINLGKKNFKFYKYNYISSTWETVNPSTEPTAFANGTYLIDIPSGVDPYSYLLSVEDARGIIVVASSFKRYTCEFTWATPNKKTLYAVAGSTAQILGAPDGNYATIGKDGECFTTDYQGNSGTIKQVYFNITYYGTVSGTLEWYYRLDGGSWVKIENLPEGGTAGSPLTRTYNASNLRASWTWSNLNTTDVRFYNNDDSGPEDAYVDAIYITAIVENGETYSTVQGSVVIELLQNGTMNWLGQNLHLTTSTKPIPPIPVKAIRVNQTINGVNQEVPFQIEDWNHNYQVPAGLTNNATVFSNRQMIVFLANRNVSKTTIWWNGQDNATQTPYAYTNRYFTKDDTASGILTNGRLSLIFQTSYRYVDGFDWTNQAWTENGASPYLNDNTTNYISTSGSNNREGWFSFEDLSAIQNQIFSMKKSVFIEFECMRSGSSGSFEFRINDGSATYGPYSITPSSSYSWMSYDISSILTTTAKINNARVDITKIGTSGTVSIRRCRLAIDFGGWLTSIMNDTTVKADFMRINSKTPTYGANLAYIIHHGIVRDVIHQEAEWSGGITNCPDVYSQIIITLPANVTYYTYKLRLIFVPTQQTRTITDLCPIKLTMPSGLTPMTENGTSLYYPIVSNFSASYKNYSASAWAHHWSQFISGTRGAGIMFTDAANRKLYVFDSIAGAKTGALNVTSSSRIIELLPVKLASASFQYALDVSWNGAVALFDGTQPIYTVQSGVKTGLWVLVEYPPSAKIITTN